MQQRVDLKIGHSACPHDCPSTCALDVELLGNGRIGGVRGTKENDYTAGVICAKVARYAERIHHEERLLHPLKRVGPRGSGQYAQISWDEALDITAEALLEAERRHGSEAVWPYFFGGTRRSIRASSRPSARRRPGRASSQARGGSRGPIRARWRSPTSS